MVKINCEICKWCLFHQIYVGLHADKIRYDTIGETLKMIAVMVPLLQIKFF